MKGAGARGRRADRRRERSRDGNPASARVRRVGLGFVFGVAVALLGGCRRDVAASGVAPAAGAVGLESASAVAATPPPDASAAAPEAPSVWTRPLLWRLPAPAGESYLLGTVHVPDARLEVLPASIQRALAGCDAFYGEIPLDVGTQSALAQGFLLPAGQQLSAILPPALHARVEREWSSRGLPFAPFDAMKPWVVSIQVTLLDRFAELATRPPLDAALYRRAEAAGKEVGGLETAAEQLAVFDELDRTEQIALLADTIDQLERYRRERRDPLAELVAIYLSGDPARVSALLEAEYDPDDPLDVKIRRRLFTERNARMSERIADKLGAGPRRSYFFAVGAGHVVGADGLVALLAQRGHRPERVP